MLRNTRNEKIKLSRSFKTWKSTKLFIKECSKMFPSRIILTESNALECLVKSTLLSSEIQDIIEDMELTFIQGDYRE